MRVARKWIGSVAVLAMLAGLSGVQATAAAGPKKGPLKVFILAGDSNCEGKAATKLLDYLIDDPATAATYKHLKAADGKWAARDDVWIRFLGRKGNLTVGYGCGESQFGIELQFGNVIGDHLQNQALLIKTAWGGSGLSRNFASPSSGGKAGKCYTDMVENVKDTLKNLKTLFPGYDEAAGYEIAGFVWFSGWNDDGMKGYEEALANLIKDVRKDLECAEHAGRHRRVGRGRPHPSRQAGERDPQGPDGGGRAAGVQRHGQVCQDRRVFRHAGLPDVPRRHVGESTTRKSSRNWRPTVPITTWAAPRRSS